MNIRKKALTHHLEANNKVFPCDALEIERRSMHKIRKTYGTALLDANVEDSLVMSQMGHSDITTTRKYYYYSRRNAEHKRQQIMNAIPF